MRIRPAGLRQTIGVRAAGFLLLLGACGGGEVRRVSARAHALAGSWHGSDAPAPSPGSAAGPTRIYVDASLSMLGFGDCASGAAVEDLLNALAPALAVDSAMVFGRSASGQLATRKTVRIARGAFCRGFFRELNNPDYELYDLMAKDSASVAIYVTDGVQSDEGGGTPVKTLASLSRHLAAGRAIGLVAFKGRFNGPLWSERNNRFIGKSEGKQRPFYLITLGPSVAAIRDVLRRTGVSARPEWIGSYLFSREMLACATEASGAIRLIDAEARVGWVFVEATELRKVQSESVVQMRCPVAEGSVLSAVTADVNVRAFRWSGTDFVPAATPSWVPTAAEPSRRGNDLAALLPLRPDRSPGFRYLHLDVEFLPLLAAVSPQLDSLSTDDDGSMEAVERTYRLRTFVRQLGQTLLDSLPAGRRRTSITIAND